MWQRLYEELGGRGFVVIAVALESRGAAAARPYVEAAKATYPCLLDPEHRVAELYGMTNVPQAVWIDEALRIVRPTEPAGTTDAFRAMDRRDYSLPDGARSELRQARRVYLDALRDWVEKGEASEYVFSEAQLRARQQPPDPVSAQAHASFRLGHYLWQQGNTAEATALLEDAIRLCPDSWSFWRQARNLEEVTKSGGPEFWARVDALGARRYYAPVEMNGMPG